MSILSINEKQKICYSQQKGYEMSKHIMNSGDGILTTLHKNGIGLQINGYLRSIFVQACVLNGLKDGIKYQIITTKNSSYKYIVYSKDDVQFTMHKWAKHKVKTSKYCNALSINEAGLFPKPKYYQLNYDGKDKLESVCFGEVINGNKKLVNIEDFNINDTSLLFPKEFDAPMPTISLKTELKTDEIKEVLDIARQLDGQFNFSSLNNNISNIFKI